MIFAVFFEDSSDRAKMREQHMQAHLAFLERHETEIQAAGPLISLDDDEPAGGLWLVEASSDDEVRRLIESDPFWPTGLRKTVKIFRWKQVFAQGVRLL